MERDFTKGKFQNFHYALGYSDGYLANAQKKVSRIKKEQAAYDEGYKLGADDQNKKVTG